MSTAKTPFPELPSADELARNIESERLAKQAAGAQPVDPVQHLQTIAEHFPHIAKRVAQFWPSRRNTDDYMGSLVMMDRDGRRGLPPEVMNAVLELWAFHKAHYARRDTHVDCWEQDPRLHRVFLRDAPAVDATLTGAQAAIADEELHRRGVASAADSRRAK